LLLRFTPPPPILQSDVQASLDATATLTRPKD
jgi:hypothetical protein